MVGLDEIWEEMSPHDTRTAVVSVCGNLRRKIITLRPACAIEQLLASLSYKAVFCLDFVSK